MQPRRHGAAVNRRARLRSTELAAAKTQPYELKRSIGIMLTVIARQLRQKFDQNIEVHGVTRARWSLVAAVARNPGATQRSIAAMLDVTEVTAGRLIDRLCGDGYLERRENPSDRRGYCVYLTAAAQPLLNKMDETARVQEQVTFANLDEKDLAKLDALLNVIARNLGVTMGLQDAKKLWGKMAPRPTKRNSKPPSTRAARLRKTRANRR